MFTIEIGHRHEAPCEPSYVYKDKMKRKQWTEILENLL